MAKGNEVLNVKRVFVHYDNEGKRIERKENDIPEAELIKIKSDLLDRFMGSLGYVKEQKQTTA